jgi:Methyltransferase domain
MSPLSRWLRRLRRTARNAAFDLRFGGLSGGYCRNPHPDATGTGATDYALMSQIFGGRIRPDDVLVDVGCGKGRVINWWLAQGVRNPIYGLEMLDEVAEHARRRLKKYRNVTIVTGDAVANLPRGGTLFYLFNPFDTASSAERFRDRFLDVVDLSRGPIILYFAPVQVDVFRLDSRWATEMVDLTLPEVGFFEERHRRLAVIRPVGAPQGDRAPALCEPAARGHLEACQPGTTPV